MKRKVFIFFLVILFCIIGFSYLTKNEYLPNADGDERSILDIPHRFIEYNDFKYPPYLSDSFSSDVVRRYPPISAFFLRNIFHYCFGFSDQKSRTFSAALLLSTLMLIILMMSKKFSFKNYILFIPLILVGLAPPVIVAARTVRFEQEVLFLGVTGTLIFPCMLSPLSSINKSGLIWFLSGLFVALASTTHPLGIVYFIGLTVSITLWAGSWKDVDGLSFRFRTILFFSGLIIGALPTIVWIVNGWHDFLSFSKFTKYIYNTLRQREMGEWLAGLPRWKWLIPVAGPNVVSHLNSLDCGAFPLTNYISAYRYKLLFSIGFYCESCILLFFLITMFVKRYYKKNIWLFVNAIIAALFLVSIFVYPHNSTYGLYISFHINMTFSLLVLFLYRENLGLNNTIYMRILLSCVSMIMCLLCLHFAFFHGSIL
ncbi:hypothetical protein LLG96_11680, partial [bacterium]|nr:hypothetical protein [bacterium]